MPKTRSSSPNEITFENFIGINNVTPAQLTKQNEVQVATNVDIDDSGRILMRDGFSRVHTAACHSMWSDGTTCLFRETTNLKKLNADWTATSLRSGLSNPGRMNYLSINDRIYYTDNYVTGVIDGGSNRTWGLTPPPMPTLATTTGSLKEGRYLCALTYVRNDFQESGSSPVASIDVMDGQGIVVSGIAASSDPTVTYIYIYLTPRNGETLYLAGYALNGTTSFTYGGDATEFRLTLPTLHLSPPPPGQNIQFYGGRVYVAAGSILYYSMPYGYELFDLAHNYIHFDSHITLLAPVTDGIWLGTTKKVAFLAGKDAPELAYIEKIDCGVTEYTQARTSEVGKDGQEVISWLFASDDGVIYATNSGQFKNLTSERYSNEIAVKGASLIREETDRTLFIVNLF